MLESHFGNEPGRSIDERLDAEALSEAVELSLRHRSFEQVDEVRAHTTLGKEPLCLSRVGAFLHAEYLNFECHGIGNFAHRAPGCTARR